jgi:uncharacterized paraquat-inducible protein A
MITKCIECDHLIVDDEMKYRRRGKAYCENCYRVIKTEDLENKNRTISSKMSKFGKGFTIPKED